MINMYQTKVIKIGNSIGVTIPKEFREENQIRDGDLVRITVTKLRVLEESLA